MISLLTSNIKDFISSVVLEDELGVLFVDENDIIQHTNHKLHQLLSITTPPELMVGRNLSQATSDLRSIWSDPNRFIDLLETNRGRAKPVKGELLLTINGRYIVCDYLPIIESDDFKGHLWIYRNSPDQPNIGVSLKRVMKSIKDVVWSLDIIQNRFLYLSPSASSIFKLPVDEMYLDADVWKTCFSSADAYRLDLEFKDLLEDQLKSESELILHYTRPESAISWVRLSAKKILDSKGKPYRLDGLINDISEETNSKKQLQLSRFQLEGITETLLNYINTGDSRKSLPFLLDNIIEISKSEYGFLGEILHDDSGAPYLKTHAITDIAWNDEIRDYYQKYVEKGIEFRNLNTLFGVTLQTQGLVISNDSQNDPRSGGLPPGHPPMHNFIGIPFFKNEQLIGMLGLANHEGGFTEELADQLKPILVTAAAIIENHRLEQDRKRIQNEVLESEQRWRLATEGTQEGIWDLDFKNKRVFFSDYCHALFGSPIDMNMGFKSIIEKISPRDQFQLKRLYITMLGCQFKDTVITGELEVITDDHTSRWLQWRGAILCDDQNTIVRMTGSLTDISRKKQADVEISKALQKQENLNELRSRFVTMASHEFKSPLTTIQTSSDLIDMVLANDLSADYDKVSKYTHRIRTQVRRLNNVLNDILVLGRLEAKQMPFKPEWLNLDAFLDDISEHVSHMAYDDRVLQLENRSKRTKFWADYNLVMHMLLNLISNAFKYSPGAPSPVLRIRNSAQWMHFDIQDFGVGMTELDKTNIFSPFYRSERVENIKGYGLGLVLVKEIVDLHDGLIEVQSEVDSGTFITIKIPFSDQ